MIWWRVKAVTASSSTLSLNSPQPPVTSDSQSLVNSPTTTSVRLLLTSEERMQLLKGKQAECNRNNMCVPLFIDSSVCTKQTLQSYLNSILVILLLAVISSKLSHITQHSFCQSNTKFRVLF